MQNSRTYRRDADSDERQYHESRRAAKRARADRQHQERLRAEIDAARAEMEELR